MPIHEVIFFKPTEVALADPATALAPASKFFSTVKGCSGLYFGASEEDKDVAIIVIVWETFEHHQTVIDTLGYPGIVGLAGTIAGDTTMLHVPFRDEPEAAFGAPVTEILLQTLKAGKTVTDLEGVLNPLAPKLGAEEGCIAGTWGEAKEDKDKSILFLGWTSSKRHWEVVGQDEYKPLIADLFAVVDIKMYHTAFKKFA